MASRYDRINVRNFEERIQYLIANKEGGIPGECWAIIDDTLVIYDEKVHPDWLDEILATRDEDGNTHWDWQKNDTSKRTRDRSEQEQVCDS